jgi:ParB family chromosome partitioning protein
LLTRRQRQMCIRDRGKGKGKITIEFAGNEDLQRIVDLIEG